MTKQIEEDKIISTLEQSFSTHKMILFVGAEADEKEIPDEISQLPWNGIMTTAKGKAIRNIFLGRQRQVKEYCSASSIPSSLFEGNSLPIIRLYGDEETVKDCDDMELYQEFIEDECNKMLTAVMRKLDFTMQLIVIGYHPGIDGELKRTTFLLRLRDSAGAKITFFGLNYDDPETEKLKGALQKQEIDFYEDSLEDMLSRQGIEVRGGSAEKMSTSDELFYKGGEPITIKQNIVLRYREVGSLLTEGTVNKIRPLGRVQQSRWLLNFLTRSSMEGPQWYGYLPQSSFYLKRDYEEGLYQLVTDILDGKENIKKDYSNPVILEGDPASSKSVVLGSIAYRVFMKKQNPVLFIDNNRLNTWEDVEALDEFMQEIESAGNHDFRILIIWDASSYENVDSMARNIARKLDNRGRRFLLVCSSYRNLDISAANPTRKYRYYRLDNKKLKETSRDNMMIAQDSLNGSFYVQADAELSDKELVELRKKVRLYVPDMREFLSAKWDALARMGKRRLFDYLYKLIVVLQPPLELGLDRERKKFIQYAQKQLNKETGNTKKEDSALNPMIDALIQAGFSLDEIESLDKQKDEISEADIHRMNICIALFSRFKLDCSVRMAIYILRAGCMESADLDVYSSENRNLLNIITTSIPWVLYKANSDNVFCFYYRSVLEAEIFLTSSDITPEDEIDMVCEMLDFYAEDCKKNGSSDPSLKESLQKLIRMIGPNSEYFAFKGQNDTERKGLLRHLDKIIDKLYFLRTDVGIEDEDASFANLEITFLREFYGANWNRDKMSEVQHRVQQGQDCQPWDVYPDIFTEDSYILRLDELNKAMDLANTSIDLLSNLVVTGWQKQYVAGKINALVVELSLCYIQLKELEWEYSLYCKQHNTTRQVILKEIRPMSYHLVYRMLVRTVHSDPLNGYAYNAVFRLFEQEYEKADNNRRYELLSSIRPIVDDAESYEIENRGSADRDELTSHITRIKNYSSKVKVSIQTLTDRSVDEEFLVLFDDYTKRGNASVITFICQQELDGAGLTNFKSMDIGLGTSINNKLSAEQIKKCEEIREFMNRKECITCVEGDANALYMLLKVTWMAYNGYPIMDGTIECRPTFLNKEQWLEINRLCRLYDRVSGVTKKPVIALLQALSVIQVAGEYNEAVRILESLKEEMFFTTSRMRVPYLICDETGKPRSYVGKVIQTDEQKHSGFMKVDDIPLKLGAQRGVRFYQKNIGCKFMPGQNEILTDLELGIGYMGLSLYTAEGRNRWEAR